MHRNGTRLGNPQIRVRETNPGDVHDHQKGITFSAIAENLVTPSYMNLLW